MATKKFQFNLSSLNGKKQQDAQNKKLAELGRTANSFNNNSMVRTNATNPNKPETMNNKTIKSTDEDGKEVVRSFSNNKVIPQIKPINLPSGTIRDDVTAKPPQNTIKPVIKPLPRKETMLEPTIARANIKPLLDVKSGSGVGGVSKFASQYKKDNAPKVAYGKTVDSRLKAERDALVAKHQDPKGGLTQGERTRLGYLNTELNKLGAGVASGLSFGGTDTAYKNVLGENMAPSVTESSAYKGGKVAGTLGQQAVLYQGLGAVIDPIVKGLNIGSKVGQFAAGQIGQLAGDIAVQTPLEALQAYQNGDSLSDFGKTWTKNRGLDIGMNLLMGIPEITRLMKSGKRIEEVMQDPVIRKSIQEELGLDRELTIDEWAKIQDDINAQISKEVTDTKFNQEMNQYDEYLESTKPQPPKPIKGKYQYDNKSKEIMSELEEKIQEVQNHFGTNQLRADEQARIKPELGIDFDDIQKRLDVAERPLKEVLQEESVLPSATKENARLAKVAGVELPKIKGAENVKPTVKPKMAKVITPTSKRDELANIFRMDKTAEDGQVKTVFPDLLSNNTEVKNQNGFDLQMFSKKEFEAKAKKMTTKNQLGETNTYFEVDDRQYKGSTIDEAYTAYKNAKKVQGVKPTSKQSNVKPNASMPKAEKVAQTATDSVKTASANKPSLKRGSKQTKAEILSDYKSKQKAQEAAKDWKAVEKQSDKIQKEVDRVEAINNRKQGEGSVEGFREGINYDKKKKRRTISEVMEGLRRDFVDDLAPLEKAEKAIYGKVQSAENSLYKTARNEKRSTNLAEQIIHADLEPIIKGVEKSGKSYRDLGEYALAVHARDVNSKGIISGFDNADIAKTIDEFGTPEMESARKELVKISNKLLEMMEESGLLSKGQVKAMLEKHPNYMPLFRHFDDEKVDFVSAFGESFSKSDAPIFALKGSERQTNDPIENMLKNIYRSVDAARKNDVGTQLIKLAEADTNGLFARVIKETESTKRKNIVSAMVDGKQVQIEVEPELYKAFTGMNKEMSNKIVEILSKPASVLRAGATLSPEFAARNPMRDMVEAFTKSESGFNPITDFPRGLASVINKDEYYDLWMRSGGGGTGIISHDIQAHRKGLLEGLKKTPKEKIITVVNPNTYLDILRGISEITEEATRLGEFKKALKGGASPQEAAYRSADLMDFTRSGASVRQVNRVVAFFNANIQGKSKLIRAIKANPKQASVKAVTSMALPTVAIFGYNQNFASKKQRQTIDDAPDWQKNTFWLIASPFDDEYVIRIPKPFELSIVANATERFMEFTVKKDPKAFDDFFGQTIKDQGMPIMPTGLIPIIEGATNYSMFRQAAIVPERERYVKRENQYDYTTSEVAKGVAKGVRVVAGEDSNFSSPRVVDYMLKSSTGGLGTYALDATDALLDALGLVDRPTKAKKDVTQMPLIKGFTVNSLSSGKSIGQLYDINTAFEKEKKSMRDEIGDNYDNNSEYKKLKEDANKVSEVTDQLSDISKEIRTINNDKKMSAESKQKKLKELNDKRNKIAYEFAKELEKAKWFKERGID